MVVEAGAVAVVMEEDPLSLLLDLIPLAFLVEEEEALHLRPPPGPFPPGFFPYMMPDTDWQINNKINPSQLPEWDRDGNAMIDYLSSISGYAAMSNKMQIGVGKMDHLRWTGKEKVWWDNISKMD